MNRRVRSTWLPGLVVGLAALGAVLAFTAAAPAQPQTTKATAPCGGVAKGAAWSYKGQKGTAYTVLGVNGASCAIGSKYIPRWTRDRATFDLKPVPAGWHCQAIGDYTALAKLGQCTTTKGGIFEWLPKRKT
jgi:hypothetical protein